MKYGGLPACAMVAIYDDGVICVAWNGWNIWYLPNSSSYILYSWILRILRLANWLIWKVLSYNFVHLFLTNFPAVVTSFFICQYAPSCLSKTKSPILPPNNHLGRTLLCHYKNDLLDQNLQCTMTFMAKISSTTKTTSSLSSGICRWFLPMTC